MPKVEIFFLIYLVAPHDRARYCLRSQQWKVRRIVGHLEMLTALKVSASLRIRSSCQASFFFLLYFPSRLSFQTLFPYARVNTDDYVRCAGARHEAGDITFVVTRGLP